MVAASMTASSARVAAKAGRTSATSAPRVGAFSGFVAPAKMNTIPSVKGSTLSASVAARVSSVKVCSTSLLQDPGDGVGNGGMVGLDGRIMSG